MNKELDTLLCLLDSKITVYRMKHPCNGESLNELLQIQLEIQDIWTVNNNSGKTPKCKNTSKSLNTFND